MSERKKKNWIPWEKADYVKELVEIINQESDDAALAEKLSVYHENDIAEAFELLDEARTAKTVPCAGHRVDVRGVRLPG